MAYGDLQRLTHKHLAAIDLMCAGNSNLMIADQLNVTKWTISGWLKSPKFQAELATRRQRRMNNAIEEGEAASARAQRVLDDAAVQAAQRLVELVADDDPKVAMSAATSVLERTQPKKGAAGAPAALMINADTVTLIQQVIAESDKAGFKTPAVTPAVAVTQKPTAPRLADQQEAA